MAFDSIQVRFKDAEFFTSPLANTRVIPFVDSYFEMLKSVVDDINTEYFWFFSGFSAQRQPPNRYPGPGPGFGYRCLWSK